MAAGNAIVATSPETQPRWPVYEGRQDFLATGRSGSGDWLRKVLSFLGKEDRHVAALRASPHLPARNLAAPPYRPPLAVRPDPARITPIAWCSCASTGDWQLERGSG